MCSNSSCTLSRLTPDLSDAAVKSILDSKESFNAVNTFEEALEYYSLPDKIAPHISLLDTLRADETFLELRNQTYLSEARDAFLKALHHSLSFLEIIQNLSGGDSRSALYIKESELKEISSIKRVLLSIYNNLIRDYHPDITIDGKCEQDWYTLEVPEGKRLLFDDDSRNQGSSSTV